MVVGLLDRADALCRVATEAGQDLAGLTGVEEGLVGLLLHERHEGEPIRARDHERVVGVPNHTGQLGQHDLVQHRVDVGGIDDRFVGRHGSSIAPSL